MNRHFDSGLKCFLLLVLAAVSSAGPSSAETWDDAAGRLADKIVSAMGSFEEAGLTVRNLSSLPADEVLAVRRALESALQGHGIRRIAIEEATVKIAVTLSDTPQYYLLTAEMERGEFRETALVSLPRAPGTEGQNHSALVLIEKKPVFQQERPILDLAALEQDILVLDPEGISIYSRENGRWQSRQSLPIRGASPWPRDLRGRLKIENDSFQGFLPGTVCSGKINPLAMSCEQVQLPWPTEIGNVSLVPGRNYFVKPDLPPFYSFAGVDERGSKRWIFAGLDGQTRLYDSTFQELGSIGGWGSDIASIGSECGGKEQVLATLPAGSDGAAAVQAFELASRLPMALGSPVSFPGPVTVLWPTGEKNRVLAVTHNLKLGRYEAYHLSVACSP